MVAAVQERRIEPIMILVLDIMHQPLVAKTDIMIRIERLSDNTYFDWSDNTFKAGASVVALLQVLEEVSAIYSPGWYRLNTVTHSYGLHLDEITNAVEKDTYVITAVQQPASDAANVPQAGEIKVGKFVIENRSPVSL